MALWLLLACGPKPVTALHGDAPTLSRLRAEGVAVTPVVVVQDLPAPPLAPLPAPGVVEQGLHDAELPAPTPLDPVRDAAFLRNEFIGNIRFGGGFIRTGDVALDVRARLMEFNSQDAYRAQATRWLAAEVAELLADRSITAVPAPAASFPVERVPVRGLAEEDGRDNLNVPRADLVPTRLPDDLQVAGRYVLVPFLRAYYSHNGGWFVGQEYGCMAGARVEVTLALFDTTTRGPVWWSGVVGRHIDLRVGQPSSAELDQFLLWAEAIAGDGLDDTFLRDR